MKKSFVSPALAFLAASGILTQTHAISFVSDRDDFNGLITPSGSSDLEGLVGTADYPENYGFGVGHENRGDIGITVEEVKFIGNASRFGFETFLLSPNVDGGKYSLNNSFTLLLGRQDGTIYLPDGVSAFGADFGADGTFNDTAGERPLDLTLHFSDGTTETGSVLIDHSSQFIGYVGKEIDHIVLAKTSGWSGYAFIPYTLLDNFVYGSANPANDPASVPDAGSSVSLLCIALVLCLISSGRSGWAFSRHARITRFIGSARL